MATVLVTGASSGFGRLTAEALTRAGHQVAAGMRDIAGRNAAAAAALSGLAVELDVQSQESADAAIATVLDRHGRLDVVVHNAGHMVLGPAEAFTPEEYAAVYDVNVLGAQRVNRAALPHLRDQGSGLLVWVGSSSTRGGHPPFLAPYFAAKAAMDALAESYAGELIRFGIDTSIVVPGAFTSGTNHFAHAGTPSDTGREQAYDGLYGELRAGLSGRLAALIPPGSEAQTVADEIVRVIGLPAGTRPFRTHVDPSRDGSEVVSAVADRIRHEFYHRAGIADLLSRNAALQEEGTTMPFANLKVPADTLTTESKKKLIDAVTDAYAAVYGERARATTLVLVEEVADGGWGLGGTVLTSEMLGRN